MEDIDHRAMLEKHESPAEAESRMSNIAELAGAAAKSEQRGETVFEFLDRASLSSELDRYDPNARTVLMTLHSAKGLEFDAVFLAGLEEGLFPHAQSMAPRGSGGRATSLLRWNHQSPPQIISNLDSFPA